jgi:hypothetical protein
MKKKNNNWLEQYDEGGSTDPIKKLPNKPDSIGVSESTSVKINIPDLTNIPKMNRDITVPKRVEIQKNIAAKKGEKKNFAVVDKGRDSIYVFNPAGNLITAEPVITGASRNDVDKGLSMKEWMKQTGNTNHDDYFEYLKSIKAQTTPAGAFRIGSMRRNTSENPDMVGDLFNQVFRPERAEQIRQSRLRDYGHQEKLFTLIDDKGVPSSKALHGTGNPKRIEAFNTPDADRAMSNGCINLNGKTVCFDLLKPGSHLFTLPEETENLITNYNFKKMRGGQANWLDKYDMGGDPFTDPPIKATKVDTIPQGYKQLGVSGNKTYYDKEAKQAIPSMSSGAPNAQWENSIRQQLQSGVSPEELVKKGHISQAAIPKYQQYYKPVYTEQAAKPTPTPTTLQSNTPNNKQPEFAFGIPYAGERKDITHLVGAGIFNYRDESGKEYGVKAYDLPGQYDPKTQKWNTNEGYSNATRTYAYEKDGKLVPFDPNFSTTVSDDKAKKVYYSKVGLDPKYISQQEQSKALEHGPLTQMPSGSDYLISQGAKYDPNLDTVSKLNQGNLSTGTFSNINQTVGKENLPSYKEYGGWLDEYEESFRYGGSKKAGLKKYTSKNIKSSINELMARNYDLFGPGGKKYYHPLAKYFDGGFNAGNALPGATQSTDWSMMANPNAVDYRTQAYPNATNPTMMQGTAAPTVMDKLTPTMGFDAKQKFDSPFFGGGKLAGLARGVMPWATQLGMQDEYRAMEQNAFAQTNANAVFRKDDQKNLGTHTLDTYGLDTFRPNQVGMKVFGQGLAYENQNISRYGGEEPRKNLNFSQMPKQTEKQKKEQLLKEQLDSYNKKKLEQGRESWQQANDPNNLDQSSILQEMWNMAQFVDPGISTNILNIGINKLKGTPQEGGDYAGIAASLIPYGKQIYKTIDGPVTTVTKPFIKKALEYIDKGEDAYNIATQKYGGWLDNY